MSIALFLGEGGPESVQTLLLPTFGDVQHAVVQILHQGQVFVTLQQERAAEGSETPMNCEQEVSVSELYTGILAEREGL